MKTARTAAVLIWSGYWLLAACAFLAIAAGFAVIDLLVRRKCHGYKCV